MLFFASAGVVLLAVAASLPTGAQEETAAPVAATQAPVSEIDLFMREVLSKRTRNWEDLYKFTVRDRASFKVRGPGDAPIEGYTGEYVWYVRDGMMVRSPIKANGVAVGDAERERFEQRFMERVREQEERRRDKERKAEEEGETLERENFLGFPFEPGNYLLAGRETFEGMEVLRIEYYPVKLFEESDEDDADDEDGGGPDSEDAAAASAGDESDAGRSDEPDPQEEAFIRGFQKTSRVTMLVLPEERQIVKITFDNVGLDFLPLRWLVRVDDVSASLTMMKLAGENVWLPREILAHGAVSLATGTFEATFTLEYFDYKRADVQAQVRYQLPDQQ